MSSCPILSFSDLCYRDIIERNLKSQISAKKKNFLVYDEPEIIDIFIWVLENKVHVSYLKMSDKKVMIFSK